MFILLYMTLKMSFFAKVIRLSLFDDANILYYRNISLFIAIKYRYIDNV
jgi:multisubunit Na+/H+ antiporter MnhC subunit